jgi:hypothetical protein
MPVLKAEHFACNVSDAGVAAWYVERFGICHPNELAGRDGNPRIHPTIRAHAEAGVKP